MDVVAPGSEAWVKGAKVVRAAFSEVLKREPLDFQVEGTFNVALEEENLLAVLPTGCGKSFLVHGPIAVRGGVALVLVPLLSVGSDQVRAARELYEGTNVECFHLDGLDDSYKLRLQSFLNGIQSRDAHSIVMYCSPKILADKSWVPVFDRLWRLGLVRFACLDEGHKALTTAYRPEFLNLKDSFFAKVALLPAGVKVPFIVMTATFTATMREDFERTFGIMFGRVIWGDMRKRMTHLCREVHTCPTTVLKMFVNRHVSNALTPNRKVILYHGLQKDSKSLVKSIQTVALRADGTILDVLPLTGFEGSIMKSHAVKMFSSQDGTEHTNLGCIVATSAGDCGLSSSLCGAVAHHGLAFSMADYAQKCGRAGRVHGEIPPLPYEFKSALSLTSLTTLFSRIALSDSKAKRQEQYNDAIEVLGFLLLSTGCAHQRLEAHFGKPGQDQSTEPCGHACWWCLEQVEGSLARAPAVYRGEIVSLLRGPDGFLRGDLSVADVAKSLYANRDVIWAELNGKKISEWKDAQRLTLQLIAAKIFCFDVKPNAAAHGKPPTFTVMVNWDSYQVESAVDGRRQHGTRAKSARRTCMAYSQEARWAGIVTAVEADREEEGDY